MPDICIGFVNCNFVVLQIIFYSKWMDRKFENIQQTQQLK